MHLILLGTSAGLASAYRASSGYLLDTGNTGILFDCGDGVTRNFLHAGYDPTWVTEIFISHTHADHHCGLSYFMQQRYLSGTVAPVTIRCPEDTVGFFKSLFDIGYLFKERMPFDILYVPLFEKQSIRLNGVTVSTYPTTHLKAMRPIADKHGYTNRGECFAMRIDVGGHVVVYSADLGVLDDLNSVTTPIETLLVDSAHVVLERLWPWAEERHVKRIVLTHLKDDFDSDVTSEAPKHTSAEILIAEDGMRLALD